MTTSTRQYDKLYNIAKDKAVRAAGGTYPFQSMLTPALRRAMVAEEILCMVYAQDDSTDAEFIRAMVAELCERLSTRGV
jgi:hypothetical protein